MSLIFCPQQLLAEREKEKGGNKKALICGYNSVWQMAHTFHLFLK
jgi:hypothetical protein